MASIGYARVSIREDGQVLDRQVDALKAAGCERTLEDRASSAHADRPGLEACLDHLRRGDVLVVLDLDRLSRQAGELIRLSGWLTVWKLVALTSGRSTQPSTRRPQPAAPSCKFKRRSAEWSAT